MTDGLRINAVVIGRNEGERLVRALAALREREPGVVVQYVDSASTDGSVGVAEAAGALVHRLDPSAPMNASRARAEGTAALLRAEPGTDAILYLDGDCEIEAGFLDAVRGEFAANEKVGVVCGWRRELRPEASLYNRLQDLEWRADGSVGEVDSCGGDSVMRVSAVTEAGGWDATVRAGEEPQLCARIREKGWTIRRVDVPMAVHDAAMSSLSDWIKRERRTGYGVMDVVKRFGAGEHPHFARIVRSARVWTVGVVMAGLVFGAVAGVVVPFGWLAAALFIAGVYGLQSARLGIGFVRRGLGYGDAGKAGVLTVASKWWQLQGQIERLSERETRAAAGAGARPGETAMEGQRA